jgi:ABC-type Fe3+-siderophore transport system permease subunit
MKHDLALWTGFLGSPLIWLVSFGAQWSLSGWVCAFQWKPALFVITVLSLLLVAGSGMLSWFEWQRVGREMAGEAGGVVPRTRLMAIFGVVLSVLSIVLILATAIPNLMLGACA